MYSFLAVLICTTVFVLVQCNDHHLNGELRFDTAVAELREKCNPKGGKYKKDLRVSMMNTSCRPHHRHVVLRAMPGQIFTPSIVSVPRCDGLCDSGSMCQPTSSRPIRVPVNVVNMYTKMMKFAHQCTFVEVEEHLTCTCKCDVKESDCIEEKQMYMESNCKCMCKDISEKKKCGGGLSGMLWNEEKCSCDCMMQNTDCTNGQRWDQEKCMCIME